MARKDPLVNDSIYHVMNKSIEGYQIFPRPEDYQRLMMLLNYFRLKNPPVKFSFFLERYPDVLTKGFEATVKDLEEEHGLIVEILALCLMPTHLHLIVRQREVNGISDFMRRSLIGYARYFNTKYNRRGPLWMSRFKSVLVQDDEQLLHLTRYVHLNPVTANIVQKPEEWEYSSYGQYTGKGSENSFFASVGDIISLSGREYRNFTEDHIGFQRELALIKEQILE